MSSLGQCDKCHQSLCMSGPMVVCIRCGFPHPNHPVAIEAAAMKVREMQAAPAAQPCKPEDFVRADENLRVTRLLAQMAEQIQAQAATIKTLQERLVGLETMVLEKAAIREQVKSDQREQLAKIEGLLDGIQEPDEPKRHGGWPKGKPRSKGQPDVESPAETQTAEPAGR